MLFPCRWADYITFSWDSSFWIFNWVSNMVYPRYDLMIGDIRAAQQELESTFHEAQAGIENMATRIYQKDRPEPRLFSQLY